MLNSDKINNMKIIGPLMVCLGSFFWATDFPVRANLVSIFGSTVPDAIQLAMFEHILAIIIFIAILILFSLFNPNEKEKIDYKKFLELNKVEILSLLFIGICGSALGIIFFNLAFGQANLLITKGVYSGFDQTLFVQKIQPIIAIALAALLLKERLPRKFYPLSVIAIIGFFFINFGTNIWPFYSLHLDNASQLIILYAFLAAACWGASTVFGKIVVMKLGHTLTTLGRYVTGGVFLIILNIVTGTNFISAIGIALNPFKPILYAALPTCRLKAHYKKKFGMKWTIASIATICELTYPIAGVILNFWFLNQSMYLFQWIGALIIVVAITIMSLLNTSAPETQIERDFIKRQNKTQYGSFSSIDGGGTKHCHVCGSVYFETDTFCSSCGTTLIS